MNPLQVRLAVFSLALALTPVWAKAGNIFKCTGADDQMHYQSTKCESGQQGDQLVIKQTSKDPDSQGPFTPIDSSRPPIDSSTFIKPAFKCAGADGHMRYQSTKCESVPQGNQLVIKQPSKNPDSQSPLVLPPSIKPATSTKPSTSVIVNKNSNNNYPTTGSIEGTNVNLLVDPGAYEVVLPAGLAQQIGVKCGVTIFTGTAGDGKGVTQGCKSIVHAVKIGNITLANVEVVILPNVSDVVVGQVALSRLKVEQADGQIRLSAIEGVTK
jgi:aspartyl protease family protein